MAKITEPTEIRQCDSALQDEKEVVSLLYGFTFYNCSLVLPVKVNLISVKEMQNAQFQN